MNTFHESGLDERIIRAITELGYEKPTPIQEKTIPFLLDSDRDIIALAQTGTGKTAAFGLPMIHNTNEKDKSVQGIVLCPTRELCMQITNDLDLYSKYIEGLYVIPVYGGTSIDKQITALKRGGQIVVGTPGRVLDLIKRKKLLLNNIKYLVLDEADEMLNMGFKEDLDSILSQTPEGRQSMLFSATMPKGIAGIAKKYMQNAEELSVGKVNTGADNVQHHYYAVQASNRYLALKRIADFYPNIYGIVFCRTRSETKDVAEKLMQDGYSADALHGDLSQAQRDHVMGKFRTKNIQILVATDVAARGLDVNDLTHIINYNLPDELEAYIHRSGRTGRAGKHGISITIIHGRETNKISQLEKKVGKTFERKDVPGGKEVCEKQLFNLIDKVEWVEIDESTIEPYLDIIDKKLGWLSREELIKRFVSMEFNRFLAYYKDAPDLNIKTSSREDRRERPERTERSERRSRERDRGERGERRERRERIARPERSERKERSETHVETYERGGDPNFTRFHINLGTKNDLSTIDLISLINKHTGNKGIEIGKIEVLKAFSFFEIDKNHEKELLQAFKNVSRDGLKVNLEISKNREKPETPKRFKKKKESFGKGKADRRR
ncbi:MAG: DEAD/DEAH box helicase [Cyclobacteriaceae bacterium]|nr:DEAD/DEAH box helicase [Cyclobacteriaceae bacterium]